VKEYQSFICAITFSGTGDVEKSEELAQETFVNAWRDLGQLKDLSKFRNWLAGIARNIVRNSLRNGRRDVIRKAVPIDKIEDATAGDSEPVETAIGKERQLVVREALQRIPEMYREALVLFYRQEQSVKEVARRLELSEETVRQRLSRGRNLLKEEVAAMVETTISRSGPGKAFTAMVMASVAAVAAKTASAAAASTTGAQSSAVSLIAGTTAKLITAAAVAAVAVGAVLTYRQVTRVSEEAASQGSVSTMRSQDTMRYSDEPTVSEDMNVHSAAHEEAPDGHKEDVIAAELSAAAAVHERDDSAAEEIDWQPEHYKTNDGPFNHLVFSDGGTVFLARRDAGRFEVTAVDSVQGRGYGRFKGSADLLTVVRGKLFRFSQSEYEQGEATLQLVEIDVESGEKRLVGDGTVVYCRHRSGRVYCVQGQRLVVYDFERYAWRDITARPFDWEIHQGGFGMPGRSTRIAVSPDEEHLAYTEPRTLTLSADDRPVYEWSDKVMDMPGVEPAPSLLAKGLRHLEDTKLVIVELKSGKQVRMPTPFGSVFGGGHGRGSGAPPPTIWLNNTTVLLGIGTPRSGIAAADIRTGEMWDIAGIPGTGEYAPASADFGVDEDRRAYITLLQRFERSMRESTYRIDFDEGSLFEEPALAGDFSIGYTEGTRCILHRNNPVDQSQGVSLLRVSGDGRHVAWTTRNRDGAWGHKTVYAFDAEENAVQKVSDASIVGGSMWVADRDMIRANPRPLPTGWQRIASRPRPSPRPGVKSREVVDQQPGLTEQPIADELPDINDVLELTLSVVRNTFKLGDELELTVKIRNKSSEDYTFELHPEVPSALDISISHPNGVIGFDFGTSEQLFPADPLELKAYKSVTSTQTIEPDVAAGYAISIRLWFATEAWPGEIQADPINIVVLEPNEFERRLKERFDHDVAEFRKHVQARREDSRRYPSIGTNVQEWARELGPHVLKYLTAELEAEPDRMFQKRLSRALMGIITPEMLPFLKKCFTDEMMADHEYIIDCLMSLYYNQDVQDEALEGLFLALTHENVRYRRNAVERLVRIEGDPRVEAALAESVHEDDEEIGATSARYLAADEGLALADWFEAVAKEPTYTRYGVARWIIHMLEKEWSLSYGGLPRLTAQDFSEGSEGVDDFLSIIRAWEEWARKNPNFSSRFFK
jgi:RNA polymerase sigma factor (sigma-70 family)